MTTLHTSHVRDRLTYHIAVAYQAIKLRSYDAHAALHSFIGIRVMYMYARRIEAATNVQRFF